MASAICGMICGFFWEASGDFYLHDVCLFTLKCPIYIEYFVFVVFNVPEVGKVR